MHADDVEFALDGVMAEMPQLGDAVSLSKCDILNAFYSMLNRLEDKAGMLERPAIRAVQGGVSSLKRKLGCPKVGG